MRLGRSVTAREPKAEHRRRQMGKGLALERAASSRRPRRADLTPPIIVSFHDTRWIV
jgi:hypothetical protein